MIEWPEDLTLGIPSIDAHHRELFRRTYVLLAALSDPHGRTDLADLMAWVGDYVAAHFTEEAELMQAIEYPAIEPHLAAHEEFTREFRMLALRFAAEGPTGSFAMKLAQLLCEWLRRHVAGRDRELAAYLHAHCPERVTSRPLAAAG